MAYQTYITDALVCGVTDSNTSNRSYLLFTKDAGMLFASARSVREERSKQRYALQEFALVRVTLIKGKAGWRIGSVEAIKNYYNAAIDKRARGSVVDIFRQLRRFIHGEEEAEKLFDFARDALSFVVDDVRERTFVNKLIKVRIFSLLGYVSDNSVPEAVLREPVAGLPALMSESLRAKIDKVLDNAVSASHL